LTWAISPCGLKSLLAAETHQGKGITAGAAETQQGKSTAPGAAETQQGKVIVAGAGKLTMEDMRGNMQYTHEVAPNAQIMCEGKKCGLSDVKMGDLVQVTVDKQGDKTVVTKIETKKADSAS
jgi:cell envelope opacity-associated protein A